MLPQFGQTDTSLPPFSFAKNRDGNLRFGYDLPQFFAIAHSQGDLDMRLKRNQSF